MTVKLKKSHTHNELDINDASQSFLQVDKKVLCYKFYDELEMNLINNE